MVLFRSGLRLGMRQQTGKHDSENKSQSIDSGHFADLRCTPTPNGARDTGRPAELVSEFPARAFALFRSIDPVRLFSPLRLSETLAALLSALLARVCARSFFSHTRWIDSVCLSERFQAHARTHTHARARARAHTHTHINNCNGNQKQKREIDAKFSLRSELYKFEADWREEGRDRRAATAASDAFRVPPFTNPKGALDERKAHFGIRA